MLVGIVLAYAPIVMVVPIVITLLTSHVSYMPKGQLQTRLIGSSSTSPLHMSLFGHFGAPENLVRPNTDLVLRAPALTVETAFERAADIGDAHLEGSMPILEPVNSVLAHAHTHGAWRRNCAIKCIGCARPTSPKRSPPRPDPGRCDMRTHATRQPLISQRKALLDVIGRANNGERPTSRE